MKDSNIGVMSSIAQAAEGQLRFLMAWIIAGAAFLHITEAEAVPVELENQAPRA